MSDTIVKLSENELKHLGLRVGRCDGNNLDWRALQRQIIEQELDVCRISASSKNELINNTLDHLGMPFYYSGSVRRFKVNVNDHPIAPLANPVTFELYDGSQAEEVFTAIEDTWGQYPIGYYRTPMLRHLVNMESETQALANFYMKACNNAEFPNNYLWLLKVDGQLSGFIALFRYENHVDSTIAGIMKNSQRSKLFYDILRHIRQFCRDHGLDEFHCGARANQPYSQRAFENEYMIGWASENVFHIPTLFTSTMETPIKSTIDLHDSDPFLQSLQIQKLAKEKLNERLGNNFHFQSGGIEIMERLDSGAQLEMHIQFPVMTKEEKAIVVKLYAGNKMKAFSHLRWLSR